MAKVNSVVNTSKRGIGTTFILVGLPLFSNTASFIIFAPLFAPGQTTTEAEFQRAGNLVAIAIGIIEVIGLLLVIWSLRREHVSLRAVINFQSDKLRTYFVSGLIFLIPTVAAGWLYVRAQTQAGVEFNITQMSSLEVMMWYVLTPITAAFLEEIIWRGYAIPRIQGRWRSLILTSD